MSKELITKLRENISRHMKPYNLGDMGETETLIESLITEQDRLRGENEKMRKALEEIQLISAIESREELNITGLLSIATEALKTT